MDFSVFTQTRAVSAASLFTLGELDTNGIAEIFRIAQEAGACTFADANFDLDGIGPDAIKNIYPHTGYLIPSLDEAVYMTGKKDPDEIADWFLAHGVKECHAETWWRRLFLQEQGRTFLYGSI